MIFKEHSIQEHNIHSSQVHMEHCLGLTMVRATRRALIEKKKKETLSGSLINCLVRVLDQLMSEKLSVSRSLKEGDIL